MANPSTPVVGPVFAALAMPLAGIASSGDVEGDPSGTTRDEQGFDEFGCKVGETYQNGLCEPFGECAELQEDLDGVGEPQARLDEQVLNGDELTAEEDEEYNRLVDEYNRLVDRVNSEC